MKIARANRVEGKISTFAFALGKEQIAALRQFAARMGQGSARRAGKSALRARG